MEAYYFTCSNEDYKWVEEFAECCGGTESRESICALSEVLLAQELEGFCSIGRPSEHTED